MCGREEGPRVLGGVGGEVDVDGQSEKGTVAVASNFSG